MFMRLLVCYFYITAIATIVTYVACIAAARADQIRKRTPWNSSMATVTEKSIFTNPPIASKQNRQIRWKLSPGILSSSHKHNAGFRKINAS